MPLIVMHMQEGFGEAVRFQPVVAAVELEIVRAVERGDQIIVAEWRGRGPTLAQLMRHLKGYARFDIATNAGMDASAAVLETCRRDRNRFGQTSFRVCGILTFHCVAATVEGLALSVPGCYIEVVDEATVDDVIGWGMFPEVPNTMLVWQRTDRAPESLGPDRTSIPRMR